MWRGSEVPTGRVGRPAGVAAAEQAGVDQQREHLVQAHPVAPALDQRVLVLGARQPGDRSTEAEAGRVYLMDHGVPADAIIPVPRGHTTLESLEAAVPVLRDGGMRSAFLVSDPWHNARVERMAEDLGIDGHASATWQSAATSQETRFEGYVRETFAYLYYRVFGG